MEEHRNISNHIAFGKSHFYAEYLSYLQYENKAFP